jgi:hypothetical protein
MLKVNMQQYIDGGNDEFEDDDIDSEIDMFNDSSARSANKPDIVRKNEMNIKILNERKNLLAMLKELDE